MKRILFIAGCWRSGSTLLGDLLGAVSGFCHVGELHHVWRRGLELNWLCGCGERFRSCPFWREVTAEWVADSVSDQVARLELARRWFWDKAPTDATAREIVDLQPEYV
ncbi:MAG: sulfotransferase, partial [bacterium]|nr:sulfotransferase [bacterium]